MNFAMMIVATLLSTTALAQSERCTVQGTAFYVDLEKLPTGAHDYKLTLSMEGRVIDQANAREILTIGGAIFVSPTMQLTLEVNKNQFESQIVSGACLK